MNLEKIKAEDLWFSGELEDDRTNTYLSLNDYDWMEYNLTTRFKTKKYGELKVSFVYNGLVESTMEIEQNLEGEKYCYAYAFDSDIFIKYLKQFLTKHIEQWDNEFAFNGEDIVIDFYNKIIEKGKIFQESINIKDGKENKNESKRSNG